MGGGISLIINVLQSYRMRATPQYEEQAHAPEPDHGDQISVSRRSCGEHEPISDRADIPQSTGQSSDRYKTDILNEIIVRYNESLHSFAYHILHDMAATEDVVQDTFLALWINRDRMDFDHPIRNFLYVTARNFAYRRLRAQKRFDNDLPPMPSDEQVTAYMIREEALRILKESIDQLPRRTAEVINLSLEGMPQEMIAEQMGVGIANVKRLKSLGIIKLKEIMGPLFSIVACLLD